MGVVTYTIPEGLSYYFSSSKAIPCYPSIDVVIGPHTIVNSSYDLILSAGTLAIAKQFAINYPNSIEYAIIATSTGTAFRDESKSGGSSYYLNFGNLSYTGNPICCTSTTGISPFANIATVSNTDIITTITSLIGGIPEKSLYNQTFTSESGWNAIAYKFPSSWENTNGNFNSSAFPCMIYGPIIYGGIIPPQSVPITYYPTGCVLQGPSEAEQGDTVNVLVTPGPGRVIRQDSIQVYNRSGLINHAYTEGILSFNVPDGQ